MPAVASRAPPAVDAKAIALGLGDDRRRSLEQHGGAGGGGQARGRRRSGRAPGGAPASRANSPSCGVSTVSWMRRGQVGSSRPASSSASASTTTGIGASAMMRRTSLALRSSSPRPGPTTSARHRCMSSNTVGPKPTAGVGRTTTSVGGTVAGSAPGMPSRTMPAPARIAAWAASRAAPYIPGDPPST